MIVVGIAVVPHRRGPLRSMMVRQLVFIAVTQARQMVYISGPSVVMVF